jgi:hypothetical protein
LAVTRLAGTLCPTPSLPPWLLAGTLDMCALTGMAEWPRVTPRLG